MTYSPNFVGSSSNALSTNTGDESLNISGSTILKSTPVKLDNNGNYQTINIDNETDVLSIVGVTTEDILNSEYGKTITIGRIENITTTATFGDILYISKTGSLTDTKPEIGVDGFVSGDFVVRIGVLFKNKVILTQKDLYLNIAIIGQL